MEEQEEDSGGMGGTGGAGKIKLELLASLGFLNKIRVSL